MSGHPHANHFYQDSKDKYTRLLDASVFFSFGCTMPLAVPPEQREGLQKLQLIPLHSDINTPKTLASIRFPQNFLSQPTAAIRNSRREQECQAPIHR
jgi:hypothetical protein